MLCCWSLMVWLVNLFQGLSRNPEVECMRGAWLIKDMWCRKWVNGIYGLIWQAKTTVSLSSIQLTLLRYSEQPDRSILV